MKVPQLREELAARDARRAGTKAVLQRRLHALLVHAAIAQHTERDEGGEQGGAGTSAGTRGRNRKRSVPSDSSVMMTLDGAHGP